MKTYLIGTAALALTLAANPASAQLLGGGGLGGGLGGQLGGSLGGMTQPSLPQLPSMPTTIDRTMSGTADGAVHSSGSRHVDARSGRVSASRSVDGSVAGAVNSVGTGGSVTGNGSAQGSANGSADAQLIGTDAVRSTAGQTVGATRSRLAITRDSAVATTTAARDRAGMIATNANSRATDTVGTATGKVGTLRDTAATKTANLTATGTAAGNGAGTLGNGLNASGSANGTGTGSLTGGFGQLALAGTGAANGQGMFAVAPGMQVTDAKGKVIGTVESVTTNARGRVEQVRMAVGNKLATLPAANFAGNGHALVSTMGKGEIKKNATAAN